MPGGRPLKFKTPEALKKLIDGFFKVCAKDDLPPTITGLCLHLEISAETLCEYEGRKLGYLKGKDEKIQDEFSRIIKAAKKKCLTSLMQRSLKGEYNAAVSIFLMKANHAMKDHNNDVVVINNTVGMEDTRKEKIKSLFRRNNV